MSTPSEMTRLELANLRFRTCVEYMGVSRQRSVSLSSDSKGAWASAQLNVRFRFFNPSSYFWYPTTSSDPI